MKSNTAEEIQEIDMGVSPADAENVQLLYQSGDLLVRFNDWKEREQEKKFPGVLAFRWQEFDGMLRVTMLHTK